MRDASDEIRALNPGSRIPYRISRISYPVTQSLKVLNSMPRARGGRIDGWSCYYPKARKAACSSRAKVCKSSK